MLDLCNVFYVSVVIVLLIACRIIHVIAQTFKTDRIIKKRSSNDTIKTLIVVGSGGHTSEMIYLVNSLNLDRYSPRLYVMASSDTWSEQRINLFESEATVKSSRKGSNQYVIAKIPRSRKVHQSYFTSIFTTVYSILLTIPTVLNFNPDLVLCNGPGTCIPVCLIAFFLKCCFISNNTIIFVESICRVKSLSLSGKILQWFADEVMVQWPELKLKCKKAKYIGRVV